jgi:hypothetical protein
VMNESFGTMPLLFWRRSSSSKTCPQPPHLLQIPTCLTILPVLFFFFFPSQARMILPLSVRSIPRSAKKLLRKNSKEQKTRSEFTYSSATFYEKKISVSDR